MKFLEFRKIEQVYYLDLNLVVQVTEVRVEVECLEILEVEVVLEVDFMVEALLPFFD